MVDGNPSSESQPSSKMLAGMAEAYRNNLSQARGNILQDIFNNPQQLEELIDRYVYSAIEIMDEQPIFIDDRDELGNVYKRRVNRKIVRYQKLPSDMMTLDCKPFISKPAPDEVSYKNEHGETIPAYFTLEFSELQEETQLEVMKKHLSEIHDVQLPIHYIRTYAKYTEWHPMGNKSMLDAVKAYMLALTSPIIRTTKYKEADEYQMLVRSVLDAKGLVMQVIANHAEYEFDFQDGSKVRSLMLFSVELIDAAKKMSIGGFGYKGVVQSTTENITRNYNDTPKPKGVWETIKSTKPQDR